MLGLYCRSVFYGSRIERWNITRLRTRFMPLSKGDARDTVRNEWI